MDLRRIWNLCANGLECAISRSVANNCCLPRLRIGAANVDDTVGSGSESMNPILQSGVLWASMMRSSIGKVIAGDISPLENPTRILHLMVHSEHPNR
jgi:hypothetical protein